MKYVYFLFSSVLITTLFSGCAGNKNLQERAPAQFQTPYTVSGDNGLELHIPVISIQSGRVSMDSVYFRGRKAALQSEQNSEEYVAKFPSTDMIMSSNPAEEYGNKIPERKVRVPFDIEDDEAVLIFTQNGKTLYYKITGITEKS